MKYFLKVLYMCLDYQSDQEQYIVAWHSPDASMRNGEYRCEKQDYE